MKSVAILIPVFNHLDFTQKCILKLNELISDVRLKNCDYQIVIIDDGSSDGTSDWINENIPEVSLLRGDGNLWWSGGINMGAKFSIDVLKVNFLLLWNNDIIPANDYLLQLDGLLGNIDDQTILGSKIYYYNSDDNDLIWSFGGFFNPKNGCKSMLAYNLKDSDSFASPVSVDWLPGMGTVVPVEIVKEIGLWDAKVFPQYHGDSDFTFRAKTAGYKIISFPQLKLWNDKTASGIVHGGTLNGLYKSLTSRRSNTNLKDNLRFYKRHSTSIFSYWALFRYYGVLIGGFCKWRLMALFGIRKKI